MAGARSLAIRYHGLARSRLRGCDADLYPLQGDRHLFRERGYPLLASPSLHPGQTVRAALWADAANAQPVICTLQASVFAGPEDELMVVDGPHLLLEPGVYQELTWQIDELQGRPIAFVGVQLSSDQRADGTVYLDYLRWDGEPNAVFTRPLTAARCGTWPGSMGWTSASAGGRVLPAGAKRRARAADPRRSRVAQLYCVRRAICTWRGRLGLRRAFRGCGGTMPCC